MSGLQGGTYEVYAYLWSDTNDNWDLQLGLAADALDTYRPTTPGVKSLDPVAGGGGFAESGFTSQVLVSEDNRTMYEVSLGTHSIAEGESLDVFVDDVPNAGGRSWYDGVGVRLSQSVIRPSSTTHYIVPANNDLGTTWTALDFDALGNGFTTGTAAIGYENIANSSTSYADIVTTEVPRGTRSTYVRIPFNIEDRSAVTGMQLNLQFDDGFVAYLNGQRIADRFAPDQLDYRSLAEDSRSDGDVLAGETFPLSRWISLLQNGNNVLAFHHLNASDTSSDYLLAPELLISTASAESDEIRYFDTPTPGGPNGLGFLGFVEDTKFSVDRGFYDEPFEVEITSNTTDASIYYTVDGSEPHPDNGASILYDSPVQISRTTNLRAAAYKDEFRPTNVDTQTYLFLENVFTQDPRRDANDPRSYPPSWQGGFTGDYEVDSRVVEQWSDDNPDNTDFTLTDALTSIPSISLTLDHDELWNRSNGIYPNAVNRGASWRRSGSIEYIDPNSDAEFQYNVGIAMHGNASAENSRLLKHSFRLRFSPIYDGPSRLEFPLFDNSDFADINQIILRGAFTDAFATRDGYQSLLTARQYLFCATCGCATRSSRQAAQRRKVRTCICSSTGSTGDSTTRPNARPTNSGSRAISVATKKTGTSSRISTN